MKRKPLSSMTAYRMHIVRSIAVTALLLLSIGSAVGQPTGKDLLSGGPIAGESRGASQTVIESVVAVVGNRIILRTDVLQRAAMLSETAQRAGLTDAQLLREVLNDLIYNNLFLVKAEEDSITVSDELVSAQADEYVNRILRQAGSESALEEAVGKSMPEIKSEARKLVREQLLVQTLQQRHFMGMKVTERDINEFYRQYKDSLPQIPEQIELAHIYIAEKPSEEGRKNTFALAHSIIDSIKGGKDFTEFVRRYSVDPGSATKGGDLGWRKRGEFVPEYEDAAWNLNLNEISEPVESKFGIHIIQRIDERENEIRTRHILLPIKSTEAEQQALIDTLQQIRSRATAGESFAALAAQYSEDDVSKFQDGFFAKEVTTNLGAYEWILDSLEIGDVSTPRPYQVSPTETGYHIIKLVRVIPPHEFDPVEDHDLLEQQATTWKQRKELLAWIDELQKSIYWEIKDDLQ
ncbi:MAG: peptidylprolyl isomerase [Candidatus Kapaibacterium sp.]